MTNEEHWTQAKQAVAKKHGSLSWDNVFNQAIITLMVAELYDEAASIMAEAIRGEYEAKEKEYEKRINFWTEHWNKRDRDATEKDKEIAELKSNNEWIHISTLPNERLQSVLLFNGDAPEYNQHVFKGTWFGQTQTFKPEIDYVLMGTITHWMPLPLGPTSKSKSHE